MSFTTLHFPLLKPSGRYGVLSAWLALLLCCSCTRKKSDAYPFPYNLGAPALVRTLPQALTEISALAVYSNDEIICEQDERGSVYIYDLAANRLKDSIAFGKDQDYEGIARIDSTIYILKSNGNIFEVVNPNTENQRTVEYKTFLKQANNTEGLCYDKQNGRLLVSCKGSPNYKNSFHSPDAKAIFSFDLHKKAFTKDPAYLVYPDSVASYIRQTFSAAMKENRKMDKELFAPSDIAVSPKDHNLYVLCSVGKLLIIINNAGRIVYIAPLNSRYFPHPEGIAFYENGDMLISNEGSRKRPANVLKFPYLRQ